jgi:hypothetical protein
MRCGRSLPVARKLGLFVVLAAFLAATAARAAAPLPVTAALEWHRSSGAESCLDADALASGVEARLRRSVFAPRERADVIVGVRLGRRPDGAWLGQIELRAAKGQLVGTRELITTAEHCSALDESLTLAIALMVDISADELPEPPQAQEPPPRAPVVVPRRAPIELPRETHAPRKPWRFGAAVLGAAAVGLLPGVAPGVRAAIGAEPPAFWVTELYASGWPAQRDTVGDGEGASLALWTVGLYLCPIKTGTDTVLGLCVGQEVGQQAVSGFGFDRNDRRTRLAYDVGLRARVSQRVVGSLQLLAGLQALLPLSRDRFVADEGDGVRREVFRRPVVAGAGELGIGLNFP